MRPASRAADPLNFMGPGGTNGVRGRRQGSFEANGWDRPGANSRLAKHRRDSAQPVMNSTGSFLFFSKDGSCRPAAQIIIGFHRTDCCVITTLRFQHCLYLVELKRSHLSVTSSSLVVQHCCAADVARLCMRLLSNFPKPDQLRRLRLQVQRYQSPIKAPGDVPAHRSEGPLRLSRYGIQPA